MRMNKNMDMPSWGSHRQIKAVPTGIVSDTQAWLQLQECRITSSAASQFVFPFIFFQSLIQFYRLDSLLRAPQPSCKWCIQERIMKIMHYRVQFLKGCIEPIHICSMMLAVVQLHYLARYDRLQRPEQSIVCHLHFIIPLHLNRNWKCYHDIRQESLSGRRPFHDHLVP